MEKLFRKVCLKMELKLKAIKVKTSILVFPLISIIFFYCGCASVMETKKKEETVRYEEKLEKVVRNLDAEEREYIRSSQISSIEKINFNLDSDGKPLDSEKLSTLNFDASGFLVETFIYDSDGTVKYRFTYDYDKNGRRTRTSRFIDSKLTNYYTYEYNEHGNKSKAYRYNTNDEIEEYYIYEYDDEGNLVEEEWFSYNGDKVYSIENDYDKGRKTHSYTYDEDNYLVYEYVFRYDDKGNVIEELKYSGRGIQTGIIQYIYKYF